MSVFASSLYAGVVHHRRFGEKTHKLRYRMFMALLDLDELDTLDRDVRLFSRNRFNLFSFHDRDHLPKAAAPGLTIRSMVEGHLISAGFVPDGGAIRLLSLPRLLGYAFNPLSVYFCYDKTGALIAILYEVTNTFRQRHIYVIPVEPVAQGPIHQRCDKIFYVSPFLDMDMTYDFKIVPPAERIAVAVEGTKNGERVITASFAGRYRPFTNAALLRAFFGHPLLSLVVVAGIHWEALKLWSKGVALRARPAPPAHPVTIVLPPFQSRREV